MLADLMPGAGAVIVKALPRGAGVQSRLRSYRADAADAERPWDRVKLQCSIVCLVSLN